MKNLKVLVITGSFGNGHLMVSNSLNTILEHYNIDVIQHDLYLEAHPLLTRVIKDWYMRCFTHFKPTYKLFYYARQDQLNSCIYKKYGLNHLKTIIDIHQPDLILNTFPTPVLGLIKKELDITIPIHTVITDYCAHKNWVIENTHTYYVATKKIKFDLISKGVAAGMIKITGIPIAQNFKIKTDRTAWLKRFNLSPDKKTILISTGALGILKGFKSYVKSCADDINTQLVIICGKNDSLRLKLKNDFRTCSNVVIIGYTKSMKHWMSSSDVLITKPGGITLTEALVTETPVILYKPTPGQEMENAIYFQTNKMALVANNKKELMTHTESIIRNHSIRHTIKSQMRKEKNQQAAENIIENIL
ncbi:Processive diacylglycerol beta-glucosyltransferase [Jeotgalicoccus aerolatus]|uniref:Processive 1,2-diacylglycerol beta-glucosyltransferase n=1 Tax=Jeotgalicoccus aerolatus TaxID=709510 RepID=A0ABS4HMW6_9STAP|nr:glycosyltransferase [Jeotgalicoccus aerolatus]MBP1952245.1 processive 1,2-diacylglycerol beta-glucosyltransferase [Jeotgalicoccus aerolatus]GGE02770.1 processive diacylglycerol beta-glucosyltransferase [Jeotgalicoccus aerolatus]CAD2072969.1 Processive diacylglycerol beta-glucosyltransferase [Jeotgalicoccus aerolatus]